MDSNNTPYCDIVSEIRSFRTVWKGKEIVKKSGYFKTLFHTSKRTFAMMLAVVLAIAFTVGGCGTAGKNETNTAGAASSGKSETNTADSASINTTDMASSGDTVASYTTSDDSEELTGVDWTLAGVETGKEEYTLQLTDEQQDNMTRAYYSVLRKTDDGMYMPVMSGVSLTPDRNGVLHVPKDPELIEMCMEHEEGNVWGFRQISSDRKQTVYSSETTGLYKDIDFNSLLEELSLKHISIYLSRDASTGDLHIMNVSYTGENGKKVSNDSIDVTGYYVIYYSTHCHEVQNEREGRTKALTYFDKSGPMWMLSQEITGVPQFTMIRASETDEEYEAGYAVQIAVVTNSRKTYGSEVIDLESNEPKEETKYTTPEGILSFRTDSDEASVTGYSGYDNNLEIPSEVDGKPVTKIENMEGSNSSVRSLIIPDSVTSIGSSACRSMSSVEEVTFPSSLEGIGMFAFANCTSLRKINLPDSVTFIGAEAFAWCKKLQSVSLPSSCSHIGRGAFFHCGQLEEIKLREANADDSATNAYKEVNGAILTADGKTLVAFPQAAGKEAVVPDGVETIGYGAFAGASRLEKVTLPDTLTNIEYMGFYDCTGLTELHLPETLTRLEDQAFGLSSYASRVERENITIHIGKNLQSIGKGAFDALPAHSFTVDEDNPYYSEKDGNLLNKAGDRVIFRATD